jgi:hypothetical protein
MIAKSMPAIEIDRCLVRRQHMQIDSKGKWLSIRRVADQLLQMRGRLSIIQKCNTS